ncbi:YbaB/EbfC family nucleoid-associated protein [Actinoplanes sp. CA-030573]|uniref:YbaB/EbfC family nucleoid-associated protein n=1 Tax=Actinoplanes sp. CA-030573 TaxID=3239898 RepID=UPI003D8ADDE4
MPDGNLADRLAALSASATGDDGVVTVTVAGAGVVTGLRLDDGARRLSGATLSDEILRTMRKAQATLAERLAAAVDETDGAEREAGRVLLDTLTRQAAGEPDGPAMPVMPFPTFQSVPTLPQQSPGNGYESGRDSRAR